MEADTQTEEIGATYQEDFKGLSFTPINEITNVPFEVIAIAHSSWQVLYSVQGGGDYFAFNGKCPSRRLLRVMLKREMN